MTSAPPHSHFPVRGGPLPPGGPPPGVRGPTLAEAVGRFLFRASVVAMAISLVAHLVLLILTGVLRVGGDRGTLGAAGPQSIQLAVASEAELRALEDAALALNAPAVPESNAETEVSTGLTPGPTGDEGATPSTQLGGLGPGLGAGEIGGEGLGLAGAGGGGGGGARFFGVEARGSRIAYIVDISGSMGFGGKMEATKAELIESVEGLAENARFVVIVFSNPTDTRPIGDRQGWLDGTDTSKRFARRHIMRLAATNGTEPLTAFQMVFGMRPRPDAIFFMTDGEFDRMVASEVALMNKDSKIPVHCICFVSRDGEEVMREIARSSGGTFTYVPGPRSPTPPP